MTGKKNLGLLCWWGFVCLFILGVLFCFLTSLGVLIIGIKDCKECVGQVTILWEILFAKHEGTKLLWDL